MFVVTVKAPLWNINFGWGDKVLYNKELKQEAQPVVQYMTPPLDALLEEMATAVSPTKSKQSVDFQAGALLHYSACHDCAL